MSTRLKNFSHLFYLQAGHVRQVFFAIFLVTTFLTIIPLKAAAADNFRCLLSSNQCALNQFDTLDACNSMCTGLGGTCVASAECPAPSSTAKGLAKMAGWVGIDISTEKLIGGVVGLIQAFNNGVVYLITWAALLLNTALDIAMSPLQNVEAIRVGWQLVRDVVNVFFIFVLLAIAIATILRVETYGVKALLVKVIIAAILINFSLVIAQAVVDASNVLGRTFVDKIRPVDEKIATALNVQNLHSLGDKTPPNVAPGDAYQPAQDYKTELAKKNRTFYPNTLPLVGISTGEKAANPIDQKVALLFIELMKFIFMLLAVFVFLALAILYIIRSVVLILVFILAPAGFLFSVLPGNLGSLGKKWWQTLLSQAFFLPASAFFLYLSIYYGYEINRLGLLGNQIHNTALAFNYLVVIILLLASLKISKDMGAYGASTVINFGNKQAKSLGTYAKKRARDRAVRVGGAVGGAFINSGTGKFLSRIPLARKALIPAAYLAGQSKEVAKNEAKRLSNLSASQQASMIKTLSAGAQREFFDGLDDKKKGRFIRAMSPGDQMKFGEQMRRYNLHEDVAMATGDLHRAMQILYRDFQGMVAPPAKGAELGNRYGQLAGDFIGKLNDEQMKNMNAQTINNEHFQDYFMANARNFNDVTNTREQINATSGMLRKIAAEAIKANGGQPVGAPEIAKYIRENYDNDAIATQVERNIGVRLILSPETLAIRSKRWQQGGGAPPPAATP